MGCIISSVSSTINITVSTIISLSNIVTIHAIIDTDIISCDSTLPTTILLLLNLIRHYFYDYNLIYH